MIGVFFLSLEGEGGRGTSHGEENEHCGAASILSL